MVSHQGSVSILGKMAVTATRDITTTQIVSRESVTAISVDVTNRFLYFFDRANNVSCLLTTEGIYILYTHCTGLYSPNNTAVCSFLLSRSVALYVHSGNTKKLVWPKASFLRTVYMFLLSTQAIERLSLQYLMPNSTHQPEVNVITKVPGSVAGRST